MPVNLGTVDPTRYYNDVLRMIVEFLDYHLHDPADVYLALWVGWESGRVTVLSARAHRKAVDRLEEPVIALRHAGDEVVYTTISYGQYHRYGEIHTMRFDLLVATDGNTGRGIACNDVSSAIGMIFARYRQELDLAGVRVINFGGSPEAEGDEDEDNYRNTHQLTVETTLQGAIKQTIPVLLGQFLVTHESGGTFSTGLVLELPHELEIELLRGTRPPSIGVTVFAKNQDGAIKQLAGNIPGATAAGTKVALIPKTLGDTFVQVTGITITGGTAGDSFRVVNIAQSFE